MYGNGTRGRRTHVAGKVGDCQAVLINITKGVGILVASGRR